MRISIVTPDVNGMPWFSECVGSMAAQREAVGVQHIVLDGSRESLAAHPGLGFELVMR